MGRRRQSKDGPARGANRAWWTLPAFLCGVFAVKLIVLSQLQDHPLLQPEGALDAAEYVRLARRVIDGDLLLGPGLYYVSPLYIYFLAATLSISDSLTFVRLVQIALGTAAVGCIFVAARAWFSDRAAWFAAVLAALTGVFTFYEIVLFQSSLDVFLTSAGLACLARAFRLDRAFRLKAEATDLGSATSTSRWKAMTRPDFWAGVLFGLQTLNRPNVAIAAGGMALSLLIIRRWRTAAWLIAGMLLAVSPVVVRNAIVAKQLALVSSQSGLNFYIGNHAGATGQYVAVPGVHANIAGQAEDTRRVAERAVGHPLTDAQASAYFAGLATTWIREHPAAALKLFARKLALVLNARHQWLDFSYPYYAYDTGSILWLLFVGPWLLVPLGIAGVVVGSKGAKSSGSGSFVVWASFVPLYAVSVAIFFVGERYRLPLFVPLCITSGGAIEGLLQSSGEPRRAIAALIPAAILTAWNFHLPDGRFEERLRLSKALMNRRDYGGAVLELQRAHAIRPADTVTEFNLGMALVSNGRAGEGIAYVRHAVEAGVPIDGARYALASAMLASGDRDGAVMLLRTYYPAETDSAESCFQVGVLALNAGAPRVAERYLQRAVQLRPGWPEALQALQQIGR
ncbi:MAG TPA: hypothetical protein VEL51_14395 [Vicinamibacterales bacterium]|nr:hypothetical protein [Vicinamibacterales bacterium]